MLNIIGISAFIIYILYIFLQAGGGYFSFRVQKRVDRMEAGIAEDIRVALESYAKFHPDHLYPETIATYSELHSIVSEQGVLIPLETGKRV